MSAAKHLRLTAAPGWGTFFAAFLVCFCAGALYGWSALIAPLQARFGVSTAQTGLVFSCAIVSFTLAVIATPLLPHNTAAPRTVAVFGAIGALSLWGAMHATSFLTFLTLFSGGFGAASGGVYIAALGVAGAMAKHTVATPAMVAAFGLGGAIFGPLWRQLDAQGWGMAALWPLVVLLGATSLIAAVVPAPRHSNDEPPVDAQALELNNNGSLHLIWLIFAFGSFSGLMVLGLGTKMMDAAGADARLASLGLAGIALGNTGGRLSVAGLRARFRIDRILFLATGLTLVGLAMALGQFSPTLVSIGLFLVAAGYGLVASCIPVLTRETFGSTAFQKQFALIFTAWGLAGFAAPWIGAALFDLSDSFTPPLLCALVVTLLFCGFAMRLRRIIPDA